MAKPSKYTYAFRITEQQRSILLRAMKADEAASPDQYRMRRNDGMPSEATSLLNRLEQLPKRRKDQLDGNGK